MEKEIDFEQELYKAFGQVKDFTLGMRIAKWFYEMGKNSQEPVSEDLNDAANNYGLNVRKGYPRVMDETDRYIYNAFKAGAKWQKEQMLNSAKQSEIVITSGGILLSDLKIEDFDYADKVKVIIIKED